MVIFARIPTPTTPECSHLNSLFILCDQILNSLNVYRLKSDQLISPNTCSGIRFSRIYKDIPAKQLNIGKNIFDGS